MDKSNSAATSGLGDSDDGSLSERIAEEIHRRILDGDIPLGSKLRQDAIASEFQVSRMPVREAFRALHGRGVIEILPRRGALVHGPPPETFERISKFAVSSEDWAPSWQHNESTMRNSGAFGMLSSSSRQ